MGIDRFSFHFIYENQFYGKLCMIILYLFTKGESHPMFIVNVYIGKCLCEFFHMVKQYCCLIVSTWEMLQSFSIPNDKL